MGTKYTNENGGYDMAVAGRDKERETQLRIELRMCKPWAKGMFLRLQRHISK